MAGERRAGLLQQLAHPLQPQAVEHRQGLGLQPQRQSRPVEFGGMYRRMDWIVPARVTLVLYVSEVF